MRHLSSIVLAVALIAAGATACFEDPTSSLRNGPSRIELTRSTMFLNIGDSLSVQAVVKDDQGMTYGAADATWTSSVPAVAVVRRDATVIIPYDAFSKAFVRAVSAGSSWVKVASHGVTDSLRVFGLPPTFTGAITAPEGLMMADTITIAATSALTFTDSTTVTIHGAEAVILSQTASQLKVTASAPTHEDSPVVLSHLLLAGVFDMSLTATTTLGVAATVRGGGATVSPATSNVGDTLTITASSVVSFSVAAGSLSEVTVGGTPTWLVSQTASEIKVIAPMAAAGSTVAITNVTLLGTVPLASLGAAPTVTVTEASEPGNNDVATPAAMTLYQDYYGTVSGSDADDYIAFTTPATGDSVLVEVEWLSNADLDIGLLLGDGSDCAPNPGACYATMGTGNNPEVASWRLLAATTYQLDVWVYAAGASPLTFYRVRTTKIQ
jgi:hypothetical protein